MLTNAVTCTLIVISRKAMEFKLGLNVDLCMGYILVIVSMTLTLMQGHGGLAEGTYQL